MLMLSPSRLLPSTMTSPTCKPMRNCMHRRVLCGYRGLHRDAHCTAPTALAKSATTPLSPAVLKMRPRARRDHSIDETRGRWALRVRRFYVRDSFSKLVNILRGSQVRTWLAAGETWIRTFGSARDRTTVGVCKSVPNRDPAETGRTTWPAMARPPQTISTRTIVRPPAVRSWRHGYGRRSCRWESSAEQG